MLSFQELFLLASITGLSLAESTAGPWMQSPSKGVSNNNKLSLATSCSPTSSNDALISGNSLDSLVKVLCGDDTATGSQASTMNNVKRQIEGKNGLHFGLGPVVNPQTGKIGKATGSSSSTCSSAVGSLFDNCGSNGQNGNLYSVNAKNAESEKELALFVFETFELLILEESKDGGNPISSGSLNNLLASGLPSASGSQTLPTNIAGSLSTGTPSNLLAAAGSNSSRPELFAVSGSLPGATTRSGSIPTVLSNLNNVEDAAQGNNVGNSFSSTPTGFVTSTSTGAGVRGVASPKLLAAQNNAAMNNENTPVGSSDPAVANENIVATGTQSVSSSTSVMVPTGSVARRARRAFQA